MEPAVANLPEPLFERAVELLRELTAISSDSGDPAGLRRAAERLAAALRERGLAVEIRDESPEDGASPLPVLYARGADTSRGHLLLIGHLDTVLPAMEPHLDGDRLVATGAIDMKGGLAAFVGALDLLRHRGQQPPADLLLVVVPDEEVGGELSRAAVRRWGETAARALGAGAGRARRGGDAETIVAGRRGMFQWRLEARGQAAHSGLHYWEGRSALVAAASWVAKAEALSRPGGRSHRQRRPLRRRRRHLRGRPRRPPTTCSAPTASSTSSPTAPIVEGEARFLRAIESDELARRLKALARDVAAATGTSLGFGVVGPYIPPVDPYGPQTGRDPPRRRPRRRARLAIWRSRPSAAASPSPTSSPTRPHPRPRRPGADRRRDAHAGGVRGAALATPADRAAGGFVGGGCPKRLNRVTLSLKEGRES